MSGTQTSMQNAKTTTSTINQTLPLVRTTAVGVAMAGSNPSGTPAAAAAVVVLLLATSLFFFFFDHCVARSPIKGHPRRLPPGPRQWPIVGSLITMLRNKPYFRWVLNVTQGMDVACIRLGGVHVIVVNSPEIAREFLRKHDAIFSSRPLTMAAEYIGRRYRTVVVSPLGDQWRKMRRVIASEVTSTVKQRRQAILRRQEADHFTKYVYNTCSSGATIDLRNALRYYSGNVIRRMVFGVRHFGKGENGGPGEEELDHIRAAFAVLSKIYVFRPSDFLPSLRCLDLDGHEKAMKEATRTMDKYHDPIIDERLEKWKAWREGTEWDCNSNGDEGVCRKVEVEDVLDAFMALKGASGKPLLDRSEISAQSAELVYATVDNAPNAVEWAMAEMLNQPETLRRAVEELDRVVGKDRLVQESDFARLPYLKACAREALRLHPIAPFNLPHVATSHATVAGYFIPKGSWVLLSRVGLGRNPKVWDDPMRFDPDRHLSDGFTDVELAEPELRFISFTTGRRGCMGGVLGTLMTYMPLARLLHAFEWTLPPGDVAGVDLAEEQGSLFLAKRLRACAKPRLHEGLLVNL